MSCSRFQVAYKANTEQMLHQYTMTKDEPLFRQARANADLLSGVSNTSPRNKTEGQSYSIFQIESLTKFCRSLLKKSTEMKM